MITMFLTGAGKNSRSSVVKVYLLKFRIVMQRKRPWRQDGGKPRMSCCCPLLPQFQVLLKPLELGIEETKVHGQERGMSRLKKEYTLTFFVLKVIIDFFFP